MFQYWVGRYIADQLNWPLYVFSGDYRQIFISPHDYPNVRWDALKWHNVDQHLWEQNNKDTNEFDIEKAISDHKTSGSPVYISKQLESFDLMRPYINYVKTLYHRDLPKADRIAIHMRFGDLSHVNGPLNADYINYALDVAKRHPEKPVLIISENSDNQWTRDMQRALSTLDDRPVHIKPTNYGSYQTDSDDLTRSTVIVATNSTFSWWAAMLSDHATEVNVFLHKDQFCSSMRTKLIYPAEGLPMHWNCTLSSTLQ